MMRKILTTLAVLFLLPTVLSGTNYTCTDSGTLLEETQIAHYVNGSLTSTDIWNQTIDCVYGCNEGKCINENVNFAVPSVFIGVGLVFAYITFKLGSDYNEFKFFFLSMSFIMMLIAVGLTNSYINVLAYSTTITAIGLRGFTVLMWGFILFVAWTLVLLIKNTSMKLVDKVNRTKFRD